MTNPITTAGPAQAAMHLGQLARNLEAALDQILGAYPDVPYASVSGTWQPPGRGLTTLTLSVGADDSLGDDAHTVTFDQADGDDEGPSA